MSARKLGLNALIYGLGGMLNRVISFLLLPLFTHYLSTEDYGVAGMLQIISVFLVAVFSLGIGGSLSSCYYRESSPEGRRGAVMTAVVMMVLSCAAMLAASLPFSRFIAAHWLSDTDWTDLAAVSLVTTALSILVQPFVYSLQFEGRSSLFVALSAATTLITAFCSIAAVAWLGMGLRGWILSQLISQVLGLVLYAAPFFRLGIPGINRPLLKELLKLGLPMIPCFGCMYVIQQGNRYAVEHFHGLGSLGIYTCAASLATVSSLAVSSFQNAWTPYFMTFREQLAAAESAFGRVTTYYFCFMTVVTVCFFAFAQPVVELMTHADYHPAWLAVGSVALANVLLGATNLLTPAQYFSGKLSHLTVMQLIAAALSVGINAGVIRWLGPSAAGFALALCYGALLVIHWWWNHRHRSMELPVQYEWHKLTALGLLIVTAGSFALLFPAHSISIQGWTVSGIAAGLFRGALISGAATAVVWFILPPHVRQSALDRVRKRKSPEAAANH